MATLRLGSQRRELAVYAGLYASLAALLKLTGFVLFLWLARTLSVEDYALFGLSYALQTGLTTFALAGILESLVGLLRDRRAGEQERSLLSAANAAFLLIATPATIGALSLGVALMPASRHPALLLFAVLASGALLAFASLQSQVVRLQERHPASMAFNFLVPYCGFAGGFIGFRIEASVGAFFFGQAAGLATALVALRTADLGFYGFRGRFADARLILAGVGPFIAIAVLGWVSGYGNTYIVQALFTSSEVARFTFGFMVVSVMQLVAAATNQVWSPRFVRLVREGSLDVERQNGIFFRWQAIVVGAAGGGLIAIFPYATQWAGGSLVAYQQMTLELLFLVSAYVVMSPWWHCYNYYLVHGEGREAMHITVVTSVIGVAVWLLLMWMLGPLGIYVGFLTQMALRTGGIVMLTRRRWPVKVAWDGVAGGLALSLAGYALTQL